MTITELKEFILMSLSSGADIFIALVFAAVSAEVKMPFDAARNMVVPRFSVDKSAINRKVFLITTAANIIFRTPKISNKYPIAGPSKRPRLPIATIRAMVLLLSVLPDAAIAGNAI